MCASPRFRVREKDIFCYQREVDNRTEQVLDFLLFDRHEDIYYLFIIALFKVGVQT